MLVALLGAVAASAAPEKEMESRCGNGVGIRLVLPRAEERSVRQGDLLLLEVRSAKALTDISGHWNGRAIQFWRSSAGVSKENSDPSVRDAKGSTQTALPAERKSEIYRALLGVDLEQAAGTYAVTITGKIETASEIMDPGVPAPETNATYQRGEGAVATHEGGAREGANDAVSCAANVTIIAGHFTTESLRVQPQFVQPDPEQIARANDERKRLREIFDHVTPERLWQGAFRVPLTGVTTGGNFGKRRVLNGQPGSPHGGVDMPAPTGTPIYAPQRGRVALAEPLYFAGNTVVLDHGLGVYTFYGHLSEIHVKPGEVVEAGALLGKVGATGRVTGPHLHWGLTVNRARVNPLELVKLL